ncbi:MAG: septum formation initiator family protein [Patescibacteria group bacterium]|nr:septum formation initiator family protein [Patescibacteria group bacterium]MBU1877057.1 septum formation initiator family protein [Patescibacteria group bacterium]
MIAKKQKIKNSSRIDFSFIFFIILILGSLAFLIISNIRITQKRSLMIDEIKALEEQIQKLQESKTNLESNISKADQDTYWEEKAREQGFVKDGENPVVVLPPTDSNGEDNQKNNQGFFQSLLEDINNFFTKVIQR